MKARVGLAVMVAVLLALGALPGMAEAQGAATSLVFTERGTLWSADAVQKINVGNRWWGYPIFRQSVCGWIPSAQVIGCATVAPPIIPFRPDETVTFVWRWGDASRLWVVVDEVRRW